MTRQNHASIARSSRVADVTFAHPRRNSMTGRVHLIVAAIVAGVVALTAPPAFAQGGGASTTGSINGKVADTSNAVLPGVTVNATSSALMGVQTSVTDGNGN